MKFSHVLLRSNGLERRPLIILHPLRLILVVYHRFPRNCFLPYPCYILGFSFSLDNLDFLPPFSVPKVSFRSLTFPLSLFFSLLIYLTLQSIKKRTTIYCYKEQVTELKLRLSCVDARGPRVIPSSYLSFRGPPSDSPALPPRGSDRSISLDRMCEPLESSRSRTTPPFRPYHLPTTILRDRSPPWLPTIVLTEVALSV